MFYKSIPLILLISTVYSEHIGAYSSPQYAKKFYPKSFDTNSLLPKVTPASFKSRSDVSISEEENHETRSSILSTAGNFLSGTGGRMMADLAKDFIARSTGSSQVGFDCISQVLSLNLTNLVILVVLKALILAAGFFGAGAWEGGHGYGRSIDDNKNASYLSEDEILLYLSYLSGETSQDHGCLYKMACQRPEQASLYYSGADLLLQGARLVQGNNLEFDHYENVTNGLREATQHGSGGMSCDRYKCGQ